MAFLGDFGKFFGLGSSKQVLGDVGGTVGSLVGLEGAGRRAGEFIGSTTSSIGSGSNVNISPLSTADQALEQSAVPADLQTALSFSTVTTFEISDTTTTVITNTGYFRVFGAYSANNDDTGNHRGDFILNDGATDKIIKQYRNVNKANENSVVEQFDFVIFLEAGDSFKILASSDTFIVGCTRQIADINGNLSNP